MKGNDFQKKFKSAVERNFNQSAGIYDAFDEKHHLFDTLTSRLCDLTAPLKPRRVLEVGCGTGISTVSLQKAFPSPPIIYALDISEAMLMRARERCRNSKGIYFIRGDAEQLSSYFHENFDAVFYTASIFLIPNFRGSLSQACSLLVPGGVLAISYYSGLFDSKQKDAIKIAYPELKYQYGSVDYSELLTFLDSQKGYRTTTIDYHIEIGSEYLFDFLSIPAQSAGIFPKLPYEERIASIRSFCAGLVGKVSPLFMGWKFIISRKAE
jgi:ubiquinone/menaquinone biosynthesis C-methylase UbiE